MKQISFFVAVLVCSELFGQIQFEKTAGPTGCKVLDYARDSTGGMWAVIEAKENEQLYRSDDDGQSWAMVSTLLLGVYPIAGIEVGPNGNLYTFDGYGWLFESGDGGVNWSDTQLHFSAGDAWEAKNRVVFLDTGELIYVGTAALMQSENGGNWFPKHNFTDISEINFLEKSPTGELWLGVRTNTTNKYELRKSTDDGLTFTTVFIDQLYVNAVYNIEFLPGVILFFGGDGIFRSTDGGQTWEHSFPLEWLNAIVATADGKVFGCKYENSPPFVSRIVKSENGGIDWEVAGEIPGLSGDGGEMAVTANGVILLNADDIWYSIDGAHSWELASQNLAFTHISDLAINPATGVLYAIGFYKGLYKSEDFGDNWKTVLSEPVGLQYYQSKANFSFSDNGSLFFIQDQKALRTDDDGDTWVDITPAAMTVNGANAVSIASSPNGLLYLASDEMNVAYYSQDGGGS